MTLLLRRQTQLWRIDKVPFVELAQDVLCNDGVPQRRIVSPLHARKVVDAVARSVRLQRIHRVNIQYIDSLWNENIPAAVYNAESSPGDFEIGHSDPETQR